MISKNYVLKIGRLFGVKVATEDAWVVEHLCGRGIGLVLEWRE